MFPKVNGQKKNVFMNAVFNLKDISISEISKDKERFMKS